MIFDKVNTWIDLRISRFAHALASRERAQSHLAPRALVILSYDMVHEGSPIDRPKRNYEAQYFPFRYLDPARFVTGKGMNTWARWESIGEVVSILPRCMR